MSVTHDVPSWLLGPSPNEVICRRSDLRELTENNCHFYDATMWIVADGTWGWKAKVKSFRNGKQWRANFIGWVGNAVVFNSDLKIGNMTGGGIEEYWWEWPVGPDPQVLAGYASMSGLGIYLNSGDAFLQLIGAEASTAPGNAPAGFRRGDCPRDRHGKARPLIPSPRLPPTCLSGGLIDPGDGVRVFQGLHGKKLDN
jgi:hypothetical protein